MTDDEDRLKAIKILRARAARARKLAETAMDPEVIATIHLYARELDAQAVVLEAFRFSDP
jgi:hypothetical protein